MRRASPVASIHFKGGEGEKTSGTPTVRVAKQYCDHSRPTTLLHCFAILVLQCLATLVLHCWATLVLHCCATLVLHWWATLVLHCWATLANRQQVRIGDRHQ